MAPITARMSQALPAGLLQTLWGGVKAVIFGVSVAIATWTDTVLQGAPFGTTGIPSARYSNGAGPVFPVLVGWRMTNIGRDPPIECPGPATASGSWEAITSVRPQSRMHVGTAVGLRSTTAIRHQRKKRPARHVGGRSRGVRAPRSGEPRRPAWPRVTATQSPG